MKTEIINIGDELLIGQVVNTNASWMAEKMNLAGFSVTNIVVIPDKPEAIPEALTVAEIRSDIVLITGGLGPTKDDMTKDALCRFFNTKLVFNETCFKDVERIFSLRGVPVTEINRKQAEIPENCTPLPNRNGTAPGMWFEKTSSNGHRVVFVSMPGVPFEMKPMLEFQAIPKLKEVFRSRPIIHKTILTQGVGESFLSDILEPWETGLPEFISLAYLPQPGLVRLRLSATGDDEALVRNAIEAEVMKLRALIPEYIYGTENDLLEEITGKLMKERGETVSTAESCTGGYIAHLITSIPGSSLYYIGSLVAYSNEIKASQLGVSGDDLETSGAVCDEVAIQMAQGIRKKFNTTYAIATTGIAGPDGGTPDKPVGLTWIAIATPDRVTVKSFLFGENRERNIRKTALQALNMLRKEILDRG